jgi:hypothetical protein
VSRIAKGRYPLVSVVRATSLQAFVRRPAAPDRREDERVAIDIAGRYMISTKRDAEGKRREFVCRVLDMSSRAMRIAAPVVGPVGDRVIAHFDEFGTLDGQIVRVEQQTMVINIIASEKMHARLAARLAWLKDAQAEPAKDARRSRRIVPRKALSTLTFASGDTASCLVMDMSATGVAVYADAVAPVGTVVAVGSVVGRVRRHFPEGFAVAFIAPQDVEQLETLLMLH